MEKKLTLKQLMVAINEGTITVGDSIIVTAEVETIENSQPMDETKNA